MTNPYLDNACGRVDHGEGGGGEQAGVVRSKELEQHSDRMGILNCLVQHCLHGQTGAWVARGPLKNGQISAKIK